MKHTFIAALAIALAAAAPALSAQSGSTTGHSGHATSAQSAHMDSTAHSRMLATLNLTAAQRAQINSIHARYSAQMKGMSGMGNMAGMSNMSGMSSMPGMDKMRSQEMADVRAVLTPEQQKRFDAMMAEHQKQ